MSLSLNDNETDAVSFCKKRAYELLRWCSVDTVIEQEPDFWGGTLEGNLGVMMEKSVPAVTQENQKDDRGKLFISHTCFEPSNWSDYVGPASDYLSTVKMQIHTSLSRLGYINDELDKQDPDPTPIPKRLWIEKLATPGRLDQEDHPLHKTMYGPLKMQIDTVKELIENALPGKGEVHSFIKINKEEPYQFENTIYLKEYDYYGNPKPNPTPYVQKWELSPGSAYYIKSCKIAVQHDFDYREYNQYKFGSKSGMNLPDWMASNNLLGRIWVDVELGSIRGECLKLYEFLLHFHPKAMFTIHWESFESLWPIYDWAIYLLKYDAQYVSLGVDFILQPKTNLLYQRMIKFLDIQNSVRETEPADRDLMLRKLAVYYDCDIDTVVTYTIPDGPRPKKRPEIYATERITTRTTVFTKLERYIRVTFIAIFAYEIAKTYARESYKSYEYWYRSWIELAEELEYHELAEGMRKCKPYRDSSKVQIDSWFLEVMVPILQKERNVAIRRDQII